MRWRVGRGWWRARHRDAGALNEATYASLAQGMPVGQLMKLYGMCPG